MRETNILNNVDCVSCAVQVARLAHRHIRLFGRRRIVADWCNWLQSRWINDVVSTLDEKNLLTPGCASPFQDLPNRCQPVHIRYSIVGQQ